MRRRVILLALALAGCEQPAPQASTPARAAAPSAEAPWIVTPDGYGPIRIGVPRAVAAAALGMPLPLDTADMVSESCGHVDLPHGPRGVALMIVADTVVRVEVYEAGVRTAAGDQVGDAEATVLARYAGRVRVEPHPYDGPEGHYLVVPTPQDTTRQLILETDGQRVRQFRAGRLPEVAWIEGCL